MSRRIGRPASDLTGKQFGYLTVVSFFTRHGNNSIWKCKCVCGNEITAYAGNLTTGKTISCHQPDHVKKINEILKNMPKTEENTLKVG